MDYELRIVVEKVAVSSEEVVQRDTIASCSDLITSERLLDYIADVDLN